MAEELGPARAPSQVGKRRWPRRWSRGWRQDSDDDAGLDGVGGCVTCAPGGRMSKKQGAKVLFPGTQYSYGLRERDYRRPSGLSIIAYIPDLVTVP